MTSNLELAATLAMQTLIKYHVSSAPVAAFPILKKMPGVLVQSFTELAGMMGLDRSVVIHTFASENRDVFTSVARIDGKLRYLVTYNQRLPYYMLERSLARELGHIVMQHDGTKPEDVREEEALCFARHFLCPRPLIRAIQEAGIPLTIETLGNVTGCYERCLRGIRKTPGLCVPGTLNAAVKAQFAEYVANFADCRAIMTGGDESPIADLGAYMENYEE